MTLSHSLTPLLRPLGSCRSPLPRQCMRISSSPFKHIEASPTSAPTSKIPIASELGPREPYHVLRTPSNQLPIYLLAKRGGNLHQTRIKKVEGDLAVLRNQLQQALKVPEEEIRINQRTRHIVIKGWRKPEVTKFLEERRF